MLIDIIRSSFPWIDELGLLDQVTQLINEDASYEQIIVEIRNSPAYKQRFPGMVDVDGTRRFNSEAEYLRTVEGYRDVLREFGVYDPQQDNPMDYVSFFDQGIDATELRDRFRVYRQVENGSQELRDSFYIYAGMDVSVDDLYTAMVSPQFRQELASEYDKQVALNPFDYETFITRATERGLQRAAETLRLMQTQGLLTGQAVSRLLTVDPGFAREVMGALFTNGQAADTDTLGVEELLQAFDYAMVASAATESGLEMPTLARVAQLRQAGVDRAKALRAYGSFASSRGALSGAVQRANLADEFTQSMFEEAALIGKGESADLLNRALASERALGEAGGGFGQALEGRRVVQSGRR